jgi:hypothetical protein
MSGAHPDAAVVCRALRKTACLEAWPAPFDIN